MKKRKKTLNVLISIFIITILFFIGTLIYHIKETKNYIFIQAPSCLEASVRTYINQKVGDLYFHSIYEYGPNKGKVGEYETKIAKYVDTIFTYQSKIVDPAADLFRGFQTGLLDIDQLYADSIQVIFENMLQKENIYAESIIGITASFYTKKNEWSNDTTALNINYRTVFSNQGDYEDINYYAYIHYSPSTIWTLMSKKQIIILFFCCIITGVILWWWLQKRKRELSGSIVLLKNGNYRIKNFLYDTNGKRIVLEEKEVKLSPQLHDLFLMFLKSDNHKVSKKDIKQQFWPKSIDSISNMTSTVNRLNKALKDINCAYTIMTDPKNEEAYIFIANRPQDAPSGKTESSIHKTGYSVNVST